MKGKWKKGSFTIEAAFLVPFILFLYLYVLQIGIQFFQESVIRAPYSKIKEMDVVEHFYQVQRLKDFMEEK